MREEELGSDPRGYSEVSTTSLEDTPLASWAQVPQLSPGAGHSSPGGSLTIRGHTDSGSRSISQNLGFQNVKNQDVRNPMDFVAQRFR